MAGKLHDYLVYGGGTRNEFRKVYPKLQFENHKIWKMISILLIFVSVFGTLYNVIFESDRPYFLYNVIVYGVLSLTFIVVAILLFAYANPNKPKVLSGLVYTIGAIGLTAATVTACLEGGFSIAFTCVLSFGGFLYLDRPVKNFILFGVPIIPYIIVDIVKHDFSYLLPTIIVWLLGLIISSYTNFRRIHNHILMFRFERLGSTDSLTGVYNKNKYDETVSKIQEELKIKDVDFAVVVFDVNKLKETNDTYGHSHGDELLIRSVELIKEIFQKSDIYRIGGDEFCCILKDEDYEHRSALITSFHKRVESIHEVATSLQRDTSVAGGLATFDPGVDADYMMVFSRADKNMYRNKERLKADNKFTTTRKDEAKNEEMEWQK